MHITVTPPCIPSRNRLCQQLPSGSGNRTLRFCWIDLSYYQYTVDPFQAPLQLGHSPAPLLPHATISWTILINTQANSFHSRPASPADVPAALVPDFVPVWVKEQWPRLITSSSPQAAFERCRQPFSPTSLPPTYPQIYSAIFVWAAPIRLCWGTCRLSSPPCFCLPFDKCTEVDSFEAPQVGLAEVAAAGRSDVVAFYFIRQLRRMSSLMKEVHP